MRALGLRGELERTAQWFSALDRADLVDLLPGLEWVDETWRRTMEPQSAALMDAADMGADETLRMQMVDLRTWLPGNMLERGDRMTMSASLEMRVPFLHRALVPFGLGLPRRVKVRRGVLKWIVRRWAERLLPAPIVNRRKWGFRVPLASWFRGDLGVMLDDYLASPRGLAGLYGDPRRIAGLVQAHRSGQTDSSLQLWTLLAAEVWYQDVYLRRVRQTGPSLFGSTEQTYRRAA
jgi:asparagine synthase (glutamine-hydrolysing)